MKNNGRLSLILIILVIIWLLSSIFANLLGVFSADTITARHNVALIRIDNFITTNAGYEYISSQEVVDKLEYYDSLENIKAIVLEINSGGGSPVGSKEIVDKIKQINNKTVVSYIRDIGASGAYWIASASDMIFSNELSIVGSIGVTSSYLQISDLLERYNVSYERVVAGKYKDIGTPFKELTDEERGMLEKQINLIYEVFMRDVAKNRNMSYEKIKDYSDGKIFLGLEAKKHGLIDDFGSRQDVYDFLGNEIDQEIIAYEPSVERNFMSFLSGMSKNIKNDFLIRT